MSCCAKHQKYVKKNSSNNMLKFSNKKSFLVVCLNTDKLTSYTDKTQDILIFFVMLFIFYYFFFFTICWKWVRRWILEDKNQISNKILNTFMHIIHNMQKLNETWMYLVLGCGTNEKTLTKLAMQFKKKNIN